MQFRTVQTLSEAFHNLFHFENELCADSRIVARLGLFRHWYHVPALDLFGPAKIIGHVRQSGQRSLPLTADDYIEHAGQLDNLDPEPTLREWFRPATEDEAFRLRLELAWLLGRYGREPNDVIYIYVLKLKGFNLA